MTLKFPFDFENMTSLRKSTTFFWLYWFRIRNEYNLRYSQKLSCGTFNFFPIARIFKELGSPSEANWPEYPELPVVKQTNFPSYPTNTLRKRFPVTMLTNSGYDLLTRLLEYNPAKRITAEDALKHSVSFVSVIST